MHISGESYNGYIATVTHVKNVHIDKVTNYT